jgi:hypothetical protein
VGAIIGDSSVCACFGPLHNDMISKCKDYESLDEACTPSSTPLPKIVYNKDCKHVKSIVQFPLLDKSHQDDQHTEANGNSVDPVTQQIKQK